MPRIEEDGLEIAINWNNNIEVLNLFAVRQPMNRYGVLHFEHSKESLGKLDDLCPGNLWLSLENDLLGDRFNRSHSGITQHDAEGRIIGADDAAQRIFSKTNDALFGFSLSDPKMRVVQSDGQNLIDDHDPVKIAMQSGEIVSDVLLGFKQSDEADIQWLSVTAIPVTDIEGGSVERVVCQIRDVSEQVNNDPSPQLLMDLRKKLQSIVYEMVVEAEDADLACREIVRIAPNFLTCPDITSIKIRLEDRILSSPNFKESNCICVSPIYNSGIKIGEVAFHYQVDQSNPVHKTAQQADKILCDMLADWLALIFMIVNKNQEIAQLKEEALTAYDRTIEAWSAALETSDKEAGGHSQRVTELAVELAREMGFPDEELQNVHRGALLHDIGKLSIPDEIILKPGKLTEDEYETVKKHPEFAQKWLSQIELLKPALQIPYFHHEKWDGTGYPQGLKGEEIPLVARMFSVVDVWDALISDRPYRRAMSKEEALDLILSESGNQFDPEVVEHFVKVLKQKNRIHPSHELKIEGFGQARVLRHNRPVTIKDWEIYAARDLLFLFLAYPKGLTKEQVGLHMWPDLSPDELDVRFKNTLYRLRRALSKQTILLTDDFYHFNCMLDYRYDVTCFITHIQKAKEAADPAVKISHLTRAVEQYQGDYLLEIEELWVVNERESYRMMLLNALVEIAELFVEQGDLAAALGYVNRALEEDSVFEAAHRLAMKIYSKLGDRAGVIRQYEACFSLFVEKFNVSPSKQTRELYEFLLQT